jgi:phosphopantothenoylcysteine decarboxylase/phosphopantothenate--cysteine ligase
MGAGSGADAPSVDPPPAVPAPRVVLGVCGGIAAYKAVELCRRLVDAGVRVAPVLTPAATRFVGAVTFSALASEPARTTLWSEDSPIPHTALGQGADLVVVAPATAHTIARYAAGLADDLLGATLLATRAPVVLCPAMHTEMWEHPSVRDNLALLERRGVIVVPPERGRLAGGDSGEGRLADPALIARRVLEELGRTRRHDLDGLRVVVSAGGTREPLDPVRVITNRSSGKQGHALAAAAARRGAVVTLVTASGLPLPSDVAAAVRRVDVETAADMEQAVGAASEGADVVVMAAAVADFRPVRAAPGKLTKEEGIPQVVLEATPDILAGLARRRQPGQVLVGFAAETHDVLERGRRKLARKGVDLLVVNDVSAPGAGFDHDTNAVVILGSGGDALEVPLTSKDAVADAVWDRAKAALARSPRDTPTRWRTRSPTPSSTPCWRGTRPAGWRARRC